MGWSKAPFKGVGPADDKMITGSSTLTVTTLLLLKDYHVCDDVHNPWQHWPEK